MSRRPKALETCLICDILRPKTVGVLVRSVEFYQPVFCEAVRPFLDPGFTALEWLDNPAPELREMALHIHLAETRAFERSDLTGLVSPKLYSKTGLTSNQLITWIGDNPDYDFYGINGQPFALYTAFNIIEQVGRSHRPHFDAIFRGVCAEIGIEPPGEFERQNNQNTFYCNYWCATATFWEMWNRDVLVPLQRFRDNGSEFARKVFAPVPYTSPTPVFLIAFIYERLLGVYLSSNRAIRFLAYPWTWEKIIDLPYSPKLKKYLADVGPWIDGLDEQGDWTAADRETLRAHYEGRLGSRREGNSFDTPNFDLPKRRPGDVTALARQAP